MNNYKRGNLKTWQLFSGFEAEERYNMPFESSRLLNLVSIFV